MKYALDTTAVIAHFRGEKGCTEVQSLINNETAMVLLPVPVLLEMNTVLKARKVDETQRRTVLETYGKILTECIDLDQSAVMAAINLKEITSKRLPAFDALIAGCAVAQDAILVHRDPHFDVIPSHRLKTLRLPDSDTPIVVDHPPVVKEAGSRYQTTSRKKPGKRSR